MLIELPLQIPKQSASEPAYEDEYYEDIGAPDTTRRYQEHEIHAADFTPLLASYAIKLH